MKKAILLICDRRSLALLAAPRRRTPTNRRYTVLLAGGAGAQRDHGLAQPRRPQLRDRLERARSKSAARVCAHPEGNPNELLCEAPAIAGFEVNAGGGDDRSSSRQDVRSRSTLRGGPGDDRLRRRRRPPTS